MSFIAAAAIVGGASIASSYLGRPKSEKPQPMEPAWQRELRKRMTLAAEPKGLERIGRAGEPYPGELVAPLSETEQWGTERLGEFLKTPLPTEGGLYGLAKGEVTKTLEGEEYDPYTSGFYQAYRTNLIRELQRAKDRIAARTSARDAFYGGGRIESERELEETAMGQMAQQLGGMYETERERRLGVVPQAMGMATYEEMAPLARIGAAREYGALPREYEQAVLDAQRQEWLRQLTDLGIPLDVATQMSTYQPPMYQPSYGPSTGSQVMQGLTPLMMMYGMQGGFGGGTGPGTPPGGWDALRAQAGL